MKNRKWLIAGILVLAELALCGAIVGLSWLGIARAQAGDVSWRFFSVDAISAEADDEQRLAVDGPATLSVEDPNGNIVITGGEGDEIVIQAHKTAWGPNQAEAEAALARLKLNITQNGNQVTVRVEQPSKVVIVGTSRSDRVDFTITVPTETAATVNTDFGDVTLSATTGDADLQTNFGQVSVTDVAGDLSLRSDFGEVTLENITAGTVTAHSNSGAIKLAQVAAGDAVDVSSDFGLIWFEDGQAGSLLADTNSGEVKLTDLAVSGDLTAHSDFGSLTLERVGAEAYDLSTNSGEITVNGASRSVKAHSDFGNVVVTNGEAVTLDLKTNSGSVTFSGSLGDGPHTLSSDFGSVTLSLPEGAALTFDLQTDFGKIRSAFPITTHGDLDTDHWVGTINGGGASLTAKTNSGDISLEILNP